MPLKHWKMISSVAAGVVVVSAILAYFSIPINPCSLGPSQKADADLASVTTRALYDSAEVVVLGRITDSSPKCEGTQIWTHMQVQVEEYLKNPQETRILTAKSIGGTIGNYGIGVEDSPIYNKGDRVLLYLYKENPEDRIYRISFPTGAIQDQEVSGNELLKSMSLSPATNDTIAVARGTSTTIVLSLESFFGYDSPTDVTATSFAFYNSTTKGSFNDGIASLSDFGLTVEPAYTSVTPRANGAETIEFKISARNEAIESVYDIYFSATGEDRFYYVNPSSEYAFVRINVTSNSGDIPQSTEISAISINIEKYGRREFYQDENVGYPTNLTISDASAFSKEAIISWPSIGPNYIITGPNITSTNDAQVVFDYYKSLAIDENMTQLLYDEFIEIRDLEPPPALFGRTFGFDWNQTNLDRARVEPGTYQVILTMPVLVEEQGEKKIITLSSEPDSFTIIEGKPVSQGHSLSLEYIVNNTNLLTGEPYSFSLYLVNNGNQTESFTVDHNSEEGSCYWRHTGKLEHPDHILPPGGKVNLATGNNIGYPPAIPGLYPYTPFVMLSIDEPARVECLQVVANTVTLNVTAPVYEGVKLVIATDKQVYQRNETVTISLYIENDSDKPFRLQEIHPSISIRNDSGEEVYGISWFADYSVYPTVAPHSRHILTDVIPVNWDQIVYLKDGSSKPAEPGKYSMLATFTYPYLKSEQFTIRIED